MNLTQMLGIVSFGTAGILCLYVRNPPWTKMGFVNLLYCLECVVGARHRFHDAAIMAMGPKYMGRELLQIALLGGGLIVGGLLAAILLRATRDLSTRLAMTGTSLGGALFIVEAISLHELDRILYRPVAITLLIAWVWLGLSITVGSAATIARQRQRKASVPMRD